MKKSFDYTIPEVLSDCDFTSRFDFSWGVTIHGSSFAAYPKRNIEQMLLLSKQMGSRLLRTGIDDMKTMDKVVRISNEYGMDIILHVPLGIRDSTEKYDGEFYYRRLNEIANRYNGKNGNGYIKYFQLDNEVDNYLLRESKNKYGMEIQNGAKVSDYEPSLIECVAERLKNGVTAVRDADTDAEIIINFCWEHFGMLEAMCQQGVDWDITGYDWYGDMANAYIAQGKKPFETADIAYEKWGKEIIVCETNHFSPTAIDEEDPQSWNIVYQIIKEAYSKAFVKGCVFYELLDEMNYEKDGYEREAHFGLIHTDKEANIGEPKAIYHVLKNVLTGQNIKSFD